MGGSQFLFVLGGSRFGLLAQGLVLNFEGRNGRIAVCQFLRQVLQLCRCLFEGRVGLRERLALLLEKADCLGARFFEFF